MSEHIFIVIILLQTSYLLNNTLQYNSSQDYFLQAPIWDRPFKKTPISFSLHNLKIIQSKLKLTSENHVRTGRPRSHVGAKAAYTKDSKETMNPRRCESSLHQRFQGNQEAP